MCLQHVGFDGIGSRECDTGLFDEGVDAITGVLCVCSDVGI